MNRHFRQSTAQGWVEDLYREERNTASEKLTPVYIKKTITHVAIWHNDKLWSLPAPAHHADVVALIVNSIPIGNPNAHLADPDVQGFLDSDGTFLTRCQSLIVALKAKQVLDPANISGIRLYARDMW
jgi:hypothetical protein